MHREDKSEESSKMGFKGISLGKSAPRKLQPGVLNEQEKEENETDFITGVSGKEIESESGKKSKPDEIVIPMQPNRLFKGLKRALGEDSLTDSETTEPVTKKVKPEFVGKSDLESNAINELLEDAERQNEEWEDRDLDAPRNLTIPGQENRELGDVKESSGSDVEDTDYDKVPISAFGKAMLRGMGWREGEGIGKTKKLVDPIQAVARPKGLGLGADRSALQTKHKIDRNQKKNDEELELKKGAYCQISQGKHEDMYGEIVSIDMENSRVYVKLTLGEEISLSEFKVRLVTKEEFTKYSKYINKRKVDKYKESEKESRNEERKDSRDKKEKRNGVDSERHQQKSKQDVEKKSKSSTSSKSSNSTLKLRPQLRVRIIDKKLSKGRYFKEKVKVLDVFDEGRCSCRTDDGRVLELTQVQIETVIPRESPYVAVVGGRYAGQLGEILEKSKERCTAVVQLLSDREIVKELDYDDICEYVGDVQSELDF